MRCIALALLVAMVAVSAQAKPFPQDIRTTYLTTCMESSPEKLKNFCECALANIERTMTFNEFVRLGYPSEALPSDQAKLNRALEQCYHLVN